MIFVLATLFFVLLQAFFSGIETGLVSLRKPRVQNGVKKGNRQAIILAFFISRPSLMLSLCLIGTNICVVSASLCAKHAVTALGFEGNPALVTTSLLLTVILLAAEIIPKDWFRQAPFDRCGRFASLLYLSYFILYVPAWLLARFTDLVVKLFAVKKQRQDATVLLREDFRMLLRESEEGGIINPVNASLLDKAVDFYNLKVSDLMIPLDKVQTMPVALTVRQAMEFCRRHGYSRYPVKVTGGNREIFVGVFSIYEAAYNLPESEWDTTRITACLRPINRISAATDLGEAVRKAKGGTTPLLLVTEPRDPAAYVGLITPLDVVNYLFAEKTSGKR